MEMCSRTAERFTAGSPHCDNIHDGDQWQRWDEEIVDEFERWIARIAKTTAILFSVVLMAAVFGWL